MRCCPTDEQKVSTLVSSIAYVSIFRRLRGIEDNRSPDELKQLLAIEYIVIFLQSSQQGLGKNRMFSPAATV